MYEFWSIDASPSSTFATSSEWDQAGISMSLETKHTIMLQYLYSF